MYQQQTLNDLLFHACKKGDTLAVDRLLGQGACASQQNPGDERTPLHYAAERGHLGVVCCLLKSISRKGLDAQAKGWTPIMAAANAGHLQVVQALFRAGADPFGLTEEGWGLLHLAAFGGYWKLVQWLLDQPQVRARFLDLRTAEGETPLLLACHRGKLKCVQPLVAAGADVMLFDKHRNSVLLSAMYRRHLDVVWWLLQQPFAAALVNVSDSIDVSPFLLSVRFQHERSSQAQSRVSFDDVTEALIALGADIHVKYPAWFPKDEVQRIYNVHIGHVKELTEAVLIPDLAGIVMKYATQNNLM